jgi:hypothetical protein
MYRIFAFLVAFLLLPINLFAPPQVSTTVECNNWELSYSIPYVQKEVEREHPGAYIFMAHGHHIHYPEWNIHNDLGSFVEHETLQGKVDELRTIEPERTIVLWVCNEFNYKIKGKNVFYFKKPVWCIPDRDLSKYRKEHPGYKGHELVKNYGNAGSVYEMVEGE